MAKYKVRDEFVVKVGKEIYNSGDVVELTDEQAADCILRIELVAEAKPKAVKEKADK